MINSERKPLSQYTNHVHANTYRSSLENLRQNVRIDEIGWRLWGQVPKRLWNVLEDGWKTSHKRSNEECSPSSLWPKKDIPNYQSPTTLTLMLGSLDKAIMSYFMSLAYGLISYYHCYHTSHEVWRLIDY
jgi:hypothetical protein